VSPLPPLSQLIAASYCTWPMKPPKSGTMSTTTPPVTPASAALSALMGPHELSHEGWLALTLYPTPPTTQLIATSSMLAQSTPSIMPKTTVPVTPVSTATCNDYSPTHVQRARLQTPPSAARSVFAPSLLTQCVSAHPLSPLKLRTPLFAATPATAPVGTAGAACAACGRGGGTVSPCHSSDVTVAVTVLVSGGWVGQDVRV
jgi:hypothetical protein